MANCWEGAVPFAFHLCCFYFSAVLIVRVLFGTGCGIRLYRFLISAFLSILPKTLTHIQFHINEITYLVSSKLTAFLLTQREKYKSLVYQSKMPCKIEPRHEKTCLQGFLPDKTQTGLLS